MEDRKQSSLTTLLIGLDAACLEVLEPLFEADALPNLQTLFEDGVYAPLESQVPPWTASAWPSLYTGMNPGKHGVFGFLSFDGYDADVVNATDVRQWTLWELLDYHGLRSVVVNVPVTAPPRSFDGALIPGYVGPEDPPCHPAGLLDDVREEIGTYRIYPHKPERRGDEAYTELVRMRGEAFRYLADRFSPDFGFVEFQQTDTVFHERPDDLDLVRTVYEEVDTQIGLILDSTSPQNVFVVSDHGMGRYDKYEFRVNEFLRDEGYVSVRHGGSGMPSWVSIQKRGLEKGQFEAEEDRSAGTLNAAMAVAARYGLTTQRITSVLRTLGLAKYVARFVPTDVKRAGTTQVDFPSSRAYMRDLIELGIRINLEGREPSGTVSKDEYEDVRRELIDALKDVRTPDGEVLFEDVAPREKYFHGPEAHNAVDIVLVPSNYDHYLSAQLYGEQFGEPTESWNHKRWGVVAAHGEAIDSSASLEGAHLYDITPTILATYGLPHDEQMDGEPLPVVSGVAPTSYPTFEPVERVKTNDTEVEDRLANLGYLE
ncbi:MULTISPECIES: alkaline phosphatase family protein [Haloferax]|uniref:Phosphodiesterase n=2 Tax=Haloferax TaxID=2251 RepID=A0A6G1Z6N5_9EURY|nr:MULTISPECIES: alkaline phosphatase family protein [Haloferax]KAB1185120.1 phosphodiesterase [Haloferax sp. CBA1149]MRW82297.1 phosphodiesterase [Haloferax marinisediminis]